MKSKTFGEIVKSHGFNTVSGFFDAINKEIENAKVNSFNVQDKVRLKNNFKPTHFGNEKILPINTTFIVSEKSNFTLDSYHIKLEGYDSWFNASVFEKIN